MAPNHELARRSFDRQLLHMVLEILLLPGDVGLQICHGLIQGFNLCFLIVQFRFQPLVIASV